MTVLVAGRIPHVTAFSRTYRVLHADVAPAGMCTALGTHKARRMRLAGSPSGVSWPNTHTVSKGGCTSQQGNRSQDAGAGLAARGSGDEPPFTRLSHVTGGLRDGVFAPALSRAVCVSALCVHHLTATVTHTWGATQWEVRNIGALRGLQAQRCCMCARHFARGGATLPHLAGSLLCVRVCLCAFAPHQTCPKSMMCCATRADCARLEQGLAVCLLHTAHAGAAVSWWVRFFG
jgi:hypothetical protein